LFCCKPASEERSLRFSSGDTEGRRGRMQIEGRELRDTETDTEGRRGRMKIEGEGRASVKRQMQKGEDDLSSLALCFLVWAAAFQFRIELRLGILSYCGIYTTGSVHRFKWSNRNRTEPARFYGFKIGLIGFLSWFGFLG